MTNAAQSGRFRIGGAFDVNRLGFGAMRIVGKGIWGPPADRAEASETLKRLPDLGVDFIDTADSYGPDFSEELIREALHPYGKIHIATKGGLARTGPNTWIPVGRPEYLIQQAHTSRWRLGVETIDPCGNCTVSTRRCRQASSSTHRLADQGQGHPPRRPVGSERRRDRGRLESLPGCDGAEPLQFRRPRERGRARPLREERHRLHPLVRRSNAGELARDRARRSTRSPMRTRRARARSRSPGS